MSKSTQYVGRLDAETVKFHILHISKGRLKFVAAYKVKKRKDGDIYGPGNTKVDEFRTYAVCGGTMSRRQKYRKCANVLENVL